MNRILTIAASGFLVLAVAGHATLTAREQDTDRGSTAFAPSEQDRLAQITAHANAALALRNSTVITLEIDGAPAAPIVAQVPIDGTLLTLDLQPRSARAANYQVLVQGADGSLVVGDTGPVRTLRGVVREVPGSIVGGSLLHDGLYVAIHLPGGIIYWLEPIGSHIAAALPNEYIVYRSDDVIARGGFCAVDDTRRLRDSRVSPGHGGISAAAACGENLYIAELACDTDVEFFHNHGSVEAVEAQINAIINTMNIQYERDVQITHVITTIIVRTREPDPYGDGSILFEFRDEWITNQADVPRDAAHLFSGKKDVCGVALTIGAICNFFEHYCVTNPDCFGGRFDCSTYLSAHELGHLWGADHCLGECCDPPFTMGPCGCANQFHPTETIPEIIDHRDTLTCLECLHDPCPADLDGDGTVGILDLLQLLIAWGQQGVPPDLDGDGTVGIMDLLQLLAAWGACP